MRLYLLIVKLKRTNEIMRMNMIRSGIVVLRALAFGYLSIRIGFNEPISFSKRGS